jgi:osmotically-inducible protein OsmY
MEDRNRNQGNQSYNQNWEQNRSRRQDDQYNQQGSSSQGYNDLDGDGFMGNTGGFYGGTSYLGANYNDWNNNMGQGDYGNQYGNQNQQRYREDYGQSNRNRDSRYYYNQDNPYGNSNYQGTSGQGSNVRYGHGFESQQPYNGNRSNYDSNQNYNRWNDDRKYSGASNYDRYDDQSYDRLKQQRSNMNWNQGGSGYGNSNRDEWYSSDQDWASRNRSRGDRNWLERAADKVSSWLGVDDDRDRRPQENRQYMSGPHRGKGPRGYQRSADRIRDDVHDRLHDDPYVDASDIEVEVTNNEVILKGHVDTREAKRRAEDIVEHISGVRHVENRLRVGRSDTQSGSSGMYQDTSRQNETKGRGDTNRDITV